MTSEQPQRGSPARLLYVRPAQPMDPSPAYDLLAENLRTNGLSKDEDLSFGPSDLAWLTPNSSRRNSLKEEYSASHQDSNKHNHDPSRQTFVGDRTNASSSGREKKRKPSLSPNEFQSQLNPSLPASSRTPLPSESTLVNEQFSNLRTSKDDGIPMEDRSHYHVGFVDKDPSPQSPVDGEFVASFSRLSSNNSAALSINSNNSSDKNSLDKNINTNSSNTNLKNNSSSPNNQVSNPFDEAVSTPTSPLGSELRDAIPRRKSLSDRLKVFGGDGIPRRPSVNSGASPVERLVANRAWSRTADDDVLFTVRSNIWFHGSQDMGSPLPALSFNITEDDVVQIFKVLNDDWWVGRVLGHHELKAGLIPSPAYFLRKLELYDKSLRPSSFDSPLMFGTSPPPPLFSTHTHSPKKKASGAEPESINIFNKKLQHDRAVPMGMVSRDAFVYDLAPRVRPIVIVGPAKPGFPVTDSMQNLLIRYLKRTRFKDQLEFLSFSCGKKGSTTPTFMTEDSSLTPDPPVSKKKDMANDIFSPSDLHTLMALSNNKKIAVIQVDSDNIAALKASIAMPILVFLKIPSMKVLTSLVRDSKPAPSPVNLSIQLAVGAKLNSKNDLEFDLILADSKLEHSCFDLAAFLEKYLSAVHARMDANLAPFEAFASTSPNNISPFLPSQTSYSRPPSNLTMGLPNSPIVITTEDVDSHSQHDMASNNTKTTTSSSTTSSSHSNSNPAQRKNARPRQRSTDSSQHSTCSSDVTIKEPTMGPAPLTQLGTDPSPRLPSSFTSYAHSQPPQYQSVFSSDPAQRKLTDKSSHLHSESYI